MRKKIINPSRLIWTLLSLVVVFYVGIGVFWYDQQTQIINQQNAVTVAVKATGQQIAATEAKKRQPVYISLPGADKIQVPVDDYESPSSIWAVVNKHRALPSDYVPSDLVHPNVKTKSTSQQVRQIIEKPLENLFAAASKDGYYLVVGSPYRSYATQKYLFASYVASAGYVTADKYSAHAGHSEHQTGLAVDISTLSTKCYLEECFTSTGDGQWLATNAYKYGFTLRYPKGKESITGYNFEPWHYRFVGVPLATALHQSGLTLDEAWPYMLDALTTLKENRAITINSTAQHIIETK